MSAPLGIVAIGRNEGERLRACLASSLRAPGVAGVVYVDSHSTDGSVAIAREMGAIVVELDLSVPFTAARARNEGFDALLRAHPGVEYVQFLDGDCELVEGYIEQAAAVLDQNPRAAVACGRRRERFPDKTIYNKLCDIEWNTPIGVVRSCGGDALIRVSAFREVGGYDASVIAGEEPEMCVRLRARDWTIHRINADMTLHDAAMTRFGQWWKRNVRAGHAYAQGYAMHGSPPERHDRKEVRSNWFWGVIVPLVVVALAWPTRGLSAVLLLGYVVLGWRVRKYAARRGFAPADATRYAMFTVIGKFAQAQGQMKYQRSRWSGKRSAIIEYKHTAATPAGNASP
jgi:GT2 family glycosyltransferase